MLVNAIIKMTTEIDLKIDITDLRDIYFRDNKQKYFFGPETRRQSIYLVLTVIIFPFFVAHSLKSDNDLYFVGGCIFFSLLVYDYCKVAGPIIKWKKSILKFLEKAEKIQVLKLKYNDEFFIHIQDNDELKHEWGVVERAIINDRFIWLFSNTYVLLPRSSMSQNEFEELSGTVMRKVKNVEKK